MLLSTFVKTRLYLIICRGRSRIAATSKMERFVIIVNVWKPLTIIRKRSILDVAAVLDPSLIWALYFLRRTKCSFASFFFFFFLKFKYSELTFHVRIFKQNVLSGSIVKFQIVYGTSTKIFTPIYL